MKLSDLEKQHTIFAEHKGPSPSEFFRFDGVTKKWQCILCPAQISRHHGARWSHIHNRHPEKMKKEALK